MTVHMARGPYNSGLSLLELLISVAVMGIIISVAVPNMAEFSVNQRLVGASEQVYGHLQQARSEAVARNTMIYANFSVDGTASWIYGLSSVNSLCNLAVTAPATAGACVMPIDDGDGNLDPGDGSVDPGDLVLMRFTGVEHDDVLMDIAGFSSGNTQFVFDPVRGTATSGQIDLESANGSLLRVTVSLLGRVAICSPDGSVDNYGTC
ncbi:MAG: hypothetical protein A3H44_04730 [Gammaproteobacteria bacterium RIFCSPLOWO2_02_FULL_57_10]|nr:MAG: hypothetical protein A3H44_04730 [Gammaproteobacteria bacterium RIFCSPLOWO2_02_FULL_57_10]